MKKLRDYLAGRFDHISVSNIDVLFVEALADGIKELEVSKEEYSSLIRFYSIYIHFPWNWSGKSIWGIRLVIKSCNHNEK